MRGFALAVLVAGVSGLVSGAAAAAPEAVFTPVIGSILGGETAPVAGSDGRHYVVYEILLTNARRVPAELLRIEIMDQETGRVVETLEGGSLIGALRTLNVDPVDDASLASSESRVVLISLDFDSAADAPARVVHRLKALAAASPGSREPEPVQYDIASLDVSRRTPPLLQAPLRGDGWLAINGCCEGTGAHRGAIQSVNGALWDSQRFAIDWMRVDEDRRLFVGDAADAESYAGYGEPVFAAAAGTVVRAVDGLADQVPGELPDRSSITLETVDGNHVVLEHGGGVYTFYAHFKAGSLLVAPGEKVRAGQQLALVGNSGNTSAPHLHFHVTTGPIPLASDGIPFVHRAFDTTQRIDDDEFDAALFEGAPLSAPSGPPQGHENQLPLDFEVVTFP